MQNLYTRIFICVLLYNFYRMVYYTQYTFNDHLKTELIYIAPCIYQYSLFTEAPIWAAVTNIPSRKKIKKIKKITMNENK
jgi:hypothetical protein